MAVDPSLANYIRQQINAGFRRQQIYDVLLQAGWYRDEVEAAFYLVAREMYSPAYVEPRSVAPEKPKPVAPSGKGFFWKLGASISHPARLFASVKPEKDIGGALKFYGMVSFIHLVLALIFIFVIGGIYSNFLDLPIFSYLSLVLPIAAYALLIGIFFGYFVLLGLTILVAGIVHFFVYMLGVGKGFHQTYKSLSYSTGLTVLLWPFIFAISFIPESISNMVLWGGFFIVFLLEILVFAIGISRLHGTSVIKGLAAIIIPILAISLALILLFPSLASMTFPSWKPSKDLVTGFQGFGVNSWSYDYQGNFSINLENPGNSSISINAVTADCGTGGNPVSLETIDPTHLERNGKVTFSTLNEKCARKEPGEGYAVALTIRYLNEDNMIAYSSSGTVHGNVPRE